jgi:hypothetical protein
MVMGGIDLGEDYWHEFLKDFDANGDGKVFFIFYFSFI